MRRHCNHQGFKKILPLELIYAKDLRQDHDVGYCMKPPQCSMTGIEIHDGDGIWDDGEWISWEWINSQLQDEPEDGAYSIEPIESHESREGFPLSILNHIEIFNDLVDCAARHFENTGRYLQLWGELGEIYAELKFGLRRHGTHMAGSDGTISGRLVEVKTISPEKKSDRVLVKSQGDFEQLLIIRINRDFQFQGKLFDRGELKGAAGKFLRGKLKSDEGE
jgi:hypothetical protein